MEGCLSSPTRQASFGQAVGQDTALVFIGHFDPYRSFWRAL